MGAQFNKDPISIGLLGIGGYARQHLNELSAFHQAGLCRLMAVADPFTSSHSEVVNGLKALGIDVYDNAQTLLERDDIDAVIIASPIQYHAPQAILAMNSGKHVYLEKPPCVTLKEWREMMAVQERTNRVCAIGFQQQTLPGLRYLKTILVNGTLGKLQNISSAVRWQRGDDYYNRSPWAGRLNIDGLPVFDGPATNAMAHVVQAALYLAGPKENEWAQLAKIRGSLKKARPIESYDSAYLEAETTSEVNVRLTLTHATQYNDAVAISCIGTNGSALLYWDGRLQLTSADGEKTNFKFAHNVQSAALLDFLGAVRGEREPFNSLNDTLSFLQLTNGGLQSSGGSTFFPSEIVQKVEVDTPKSWYEVADLDTQFEQFSADPTDPPPLFNPIGQWLKPEQLSETL
jgi:predicted dehydrogenase